MSEIKDYPIYNYSAWEKVLRNEVIPEGVRSGKIRLLDVDEISKSPCLVASSAPRNPTGTHASRGYPGGRKAWIQAFECWFKKMTYDSLMGTLRRPYQHAARLSIKLPQYKVIPARRDVAKEVKIYCWPEHYGLTVWKRPAAEISQKDWEDIVRILVAEIKFRKAKSSKNPYEDAYVSNPIKHIRDWKTVVNLSREEVLRLRTPSRKKCIKCVPDVIWRVNRLSGPRARIVAKTGKWEELPNIIIPSPSSFNNRSGIHIEIEKVFLKSVDEYKERQERKLDRVIEKDEEIVSWWDRLSSIRKNDLIAQSEEISNLWKEAENKVREHYEIPRIGEGWISEVKLLNLVRDTFPQETIIHHAKPKWLGRFHLDIFLPKRKIAIEYQGEQHFEPIDIFGGWDGLNKTQRRDRRKFELCSQNGVKLIYFYSDDKITRDLVKRRINDITKERK